MTTIVKTIHRVMPYLVDDAKAKALKPKHAWGYKPRKIFNQSRYDAAVELNERLGISPLKFQKERKARIPDGILYRQLRRSAKSKKHVTVPALSFLDGE